MRRGEEHEQNMEKKVADDIKKVLKKVVGESRGNIPEHKQT